jgi:hypothetical protein
MQMIHGFLDFDPDIGSGRRGGKLNRIGFLALGVIDESGIHGGRRLADWFDAEGFVAGPRVCFFLRACLDSRYLGDNGHLAKRYFR